MHPVFASWFTTILVRPIFNLLVLIYAIIPGHNFGLAIIIFTILVRFLMYPLLKKQLHHTKAMRDLQPLLKQIKKKAAGDKQKESQLTMELYKEKQINPVASLGIVLVQLPLFLALFAGLRKIVADPHAMVNFSYGAVRDLPWMKQLAGNIHLFDNTLFGLVDLSKKAIGNPNGIYWPAMFIVVASSITQYFQIKQTTPTDKDARNLRTILKDAGSGKVADNTEVNAALGKNMSYVFPFIIFFLTVSFAAALSLYWFVSGLVAYVQQARLLKEDVEEMEEIADEPSFKKAAAAARGTRSGKKAEPIEAEIVAEPEVTAGSQEAASSKKANSTKTKKRAQKRKKRKG